MPALLSIPNDEAAILARAVDSSNWQLNSEAARAIIELRLTEDDRQRMNELASKARSGELNADEEVEIENYRQVGCLVELLKSRARLFLRKASV